MEYPQVRPPAGGVTHLLFHLPLGAGQGFFSGLQCASRKFEYVPSNGMSILAGQEHRSVRVYWKDQDRPRMVDRILLHLETGRKTNTVAYQFEALPGGDRFGFENADWVLLAHLLGQPSDARILALASQDATVVSGLIRGLRHVTWQSGRPMS